MAKDLRFGNLERNDVRGALRFVEQELDAGRLAPETARSLYLLQDDPAEYVAELGKMVAERIADTKSVGPFRPV